MNGPTLDLMKYRVEHAPYITIARIMRALGCGDSNLKILMRKAHNIIVPPGGNPEIYYIVTEETMNQIAQDMKHNKAEGEAREKIELGLKVGTSTCMGLTEESTKEAFRKMVDIHNSL